MFLMTIEKMAKTQTIKLLNSEKTVIEKNYGFDQVFNIFDKIENKWNELNEAKPRSFNQINAKNAVLDYLKVV